MASDKQPILLPSAKEIKKNLHQIFNESIKLKSLEKKELKRSLAEHLIFESTIPILSSVLIEKRLRFALKWKQWKPRKIKLSHKGNACIHAFMHSFIPFKLQSHIITCYPIVAYNHCV